MKPDKQQCELMGADIMQSTQAVMASSSSNNATARVHSKGDWDALRDVITILYLNENKTLAQVARILHKDYYFVATNRQYKRKLMEWGLHKYLKRSEMKAIAQKQQERTELGKQTVVHVRGQKIDEEKISRWMKRNAKQEPSSEAHGSEHSGSIGTPPGILVYTPRATPSDDRSSPPDTIYYEQVLQWISSVDPFINHRQACEQHLSGTGGWLLDKPEFMRWIESPRSMLWLNGIAGCGKTILSSTIIENIRSQSQYDRESKVAYFYFDYKDRKKQDLSNLFRSLIFQLSSKNGVPSRSLLNLYAKSRNGKYPAELFDLKNYLADMILEHDRVYILLDALDECTERPGLLEWLSQILKQNIGRLHLFASSRCEMDIMEYLNQMSVETISVQKTDLVSDLSVFIEHQIENRPSLSKRPLIVKAEITEALMERSNGMFLWVTCQLDLLQECFSHKAIQLALKNLSTNLDDTYARVLVNINNGHREDSLRVLQWLVFSTVPLRIEEVAEILIAKPDSHSTVAIEDRLFDPTHILLDLGFLVTLQEPSKSDLACDSSIVANTGVELSLAHFSVREYLLSQRILDCCPEYNIRETAANLSIAGTCLTYLFQFANLQSLPIDALNMYPLAGYAAQHWAEHVRKAGQDIGSFELDNRVVEFLYHEQLCSNWIRLYNPDASWEESKMAEQVTAAPTPLYYATLLGLLRPTRILLTQGAAVNARGGYYGNALEAASAKGYEDIVDLLLSAGADVDPREGGHYRSPLQAAAAIGHEKIVRLLLESGADLNARGGYYGSALEAASAGGYDQIVKLLLSWGADPDAQGGGCYGTPLQAAAERGHDKIVIFLIEHGADVNVNTGYYGTPIQAAAAGGHEGIVRRLISYGADIEAQGGALGNALQAASAKGYSDIVKILINSGADVNTQGAHYGNALQAASEKGHSDIVRMLINSGADVNAQGAYYGNALQAASAKGYGDIVEMLINSGADVNAQEAYYGNALQAASAKGYSDIVKILINSGADVKVQGAHYGNALQAASEKGHSDIVRMLINSGADVNAQGAYYGNALQAASAKGYGDIVDILINSGADVNAIGGNYDNATKAASEGGYSSIVKLLLNAGADLKSQGGF